MQFDVLCSFFFDILVTEWTDRGATLNLLLSARKVNNCITNKAVKSARKRIILTSKNPFVMAIYLGDIDVCLELVSRMPLPLSSVILVVDWMYAHVTHNDIRDSAAFRDAVGSLEDFEKASEGQLVFAFPAAFEQMSVTDRPKHRGPLSKGTVAFLIPYICWDPEVASGIPGLIEALTGNYDAESKKWIAFWEPTVQRLKLMLERDQVVRRAMLANIRLSTTPLDPSVSALM